jgi:Putative enzyme of poly-gamma-glutamate biosynthesis (capsule formation)
VNSLKKTLGFIFIFIIMLSAALTFVIIGLINGGGNKPSAQSLSSAQGSAQSGRTGRTLAIADGDFALQLGQSHQCSALFDGNIPAENLTWSSTDESVVTIDGSGRVTAVGVGEAEILAVAGRGLKARAGVSVYEDFGAAAVAAVSALAADGSAGSMSLVAQMTARIGNSRSPDAAAVHRLLRAVTAFADAGAQGEGDSSALWKELLSAAKEAKADALTQNTLRKAAIVAYCHGERVSSEATVSFTGDCTFAYFNDETSNARFPTVYKKSGSVTYPFDLTKAVFATDDITMINFEGTLTDYRKHKSKKFYFRGDPSYVNILTGSSVEAVTLENNHAYDYFETGFYDTIDTLRNAGVRYTSYYSPAVMDVGAIRVVMLSLCMINSEYTDEFREHIEKYIAQYRGKNTVIVVNVHWGVELEDTPLPSQREAAHAMIDAGADLVVGHHPHLLQGVEDYNGHYIFYSLGNFSFGGNTEVKNPQTIILRVMFGRDENGRAAVTRVSVIPCLTTSTGSTKNNYRPVPLYGSKGKAVVTKLLKLSSKLEGGVDSLTWHRIP